MVSVVQYDCLFSRFIVCPVMTSCIYFRQTNLRAKICIHGVTWFLNTISARTNFSGPNAVNLAKQDERRHIRMPHWLSGRIVRQGVSRWIRNGTKTIESERCQVERKTRFRQRFGNEITTAPGGLLNGRRIRQSWRSHMYLPLPRRHGFSTDMSNTAGFWPYIFIDISHSFIYTTLPPFRVGLQTRNN